MKREKWTIAYDKDNDEWYCLQFDGKVAWYRYAKSDLVKLATKHLRDRWKIGGAASELTIKKKNGRVQDKRTYGRDPRKTKG